MYLPRRFPPRAECRCGCASDPESARPRERRPAAAPRLTSLCPLRPPGTFRGTVPPNLPEVSMLNSELRVQIRHWFYAEHWKVGTIAQQLGLHPDNVRHALETEQFNRARPVRPLVTDPYVEFIGQTLQKFPPLRATRIHQENR